MFALTASRGDSQSGMPSLEIFLVALQRLWILLIISQYTFAGCFPRRKLSIGTRQSTTYGCLQHLAELSKPTALFHRWLKRAVQAPLDEIPSRNPKHY